MKSENEVRGLIEAVLSELESDPNLAARLREILKGRDTRSTTKKRPSRHRRPPGAFDPFEVYANGDEPALRSRLQELNIEQLKDMVAEHGMDQAKLAMKWRTSNRLIDLIATTVRDRARKGDAFRLRPTD